MAEFWDEMFKEKQEMWGFEPAKSTIVVKDFFLKEDIQDILIPGVGYGRNAKVFLDAGIVVTGIEISPTAIEIANKHFGKKLPIYCGSVNEMPFDTNLYEGIYCYALIHLLDSSERLQLIENCYNQLAEGGFMVFTTITKQAETYGQGECIGVERYKLFGAVDMYFYDEDSIKFDFEKFGLVSIEEIQDTYPFYIIYCKK